MTQLLDLGGQVMYKVPLYLIGSMGQQPFFFYNLTLKSQGLTPGFIVSSDLLGSRTCSN